MKRSFSPCALLFIIFAGVGAANEAETKFGTYSYKHEFLHKHGVIDDLLSKTGKSCCDGGMGGECRATLLRNNGETWEFLHYQTWCPVSSQVRFDVVFPDAVTEENISAVVCASKTALHVCPSQTYCSAQWFSPG